ncbi:LamG domain-containing protein [Phytohabitans rumicis]|uniref:LamG-like jellyroll fold domain-containing protein n=1 Tax=Phytohabitans rumicis TaxID=1076125 RepID=A0A6V8KX42_9ACTN|nr:LamG domain-containing protein [Phytohabitans rumicis]GFJ86869.1 hypothetical protein Prum_005110 [Phytohabitans rumicis]
MRRATDRVRIAAVLALLMAAAPVAPPGRAQAARPAAPAPLSEAAASARAQATGKPVEVGALTSETRKVMANPDGTFTADLAAGPARFKDSAGAWRDVDLTLERRPDGSVAPRAHPRGLVLSGAAGGGIHDLATLGSGPARVALGWRGALPKPLLSGVTATYPDVRPGVDLVVEVRRTGFEESLVVRSRSGLSAVGSIALPWRVAGVTPRAAADGGFELRGPGGGSVGRIHPARMWDARVAPGSGEHTHVAAVPMRTLAVADGLGTDVSLVPDAKLLSDPKLQFPVTVDPAVTYYPAGFDAFVQSNFTTDQSGASELKLGFTDDTGSYTARSFLRWDTSALIGRHVLGATIYLYETWAWSCRAFRWQVYVTGWADTSTRWSNQPWWGGLLDWGSTMTKGYDPCGSADGWVTSDVRNTFQWAADNSVSLFTTGIRADPADEGNHDSWKRFHSAEAANDPHVAVTYNTKPNTPDTLRIDGKTCGTGAGRPAVDTVTGQPAMQARLTDPDGTEASLTGSFYLAELGTALPATPTVVASAVASGNSATAVIPTAFALQEGHVYHWQARTYDGNDHSVMTGDCEFIVDNGGPTTAPLISSTDYPADGNYHGGLGVTGSFTLSANGAPDVAKYRYWWEGKPFREVAAPTLSATVTVPITPPYPDVARLLDDVTVAGPRVLHVASVDPVGHVGPDRTFSVLVGSAPAPAGWWKLDDGAAATQLADSSGRNRPLTAEAAAPAKQNTGWGDGGSAYTFNGSTTALKAGQPVLNTAKSFSVSAWARLTAFQSSSQNVVSQDGARMSGFQLWYAQVENRWQLQMAEDDVDFASRTEALSTRAGQIGAWTHLAGVYDAETKQMRLYVNGSLEAGATLARGFNATGSLRIGRAQWNGLSVDWFNGDIDDVRVWQRVIDPREIAALATAEVGRWTLDSTVADTSGFGHDLSPEGNAGFDYVGNDPADAGSALLDGWGSWFATAGPVARTDQSFSVSAWARVSAVPTGNITAIAQDGTGQSGFYLGLKHDGTAPHWSMSMVDTDAQATGWVTAAAAPVITNADVGRWYHLVGVFDRPAQQIRLYVDGVLAATATRTAFWSSTGVFTVGRAQWYSSVGPLQVDFWHGAIDDVRVYAGVLTPNRIAMIDDGQL